MGIRQADHERLGDQVACKHLVGHRIGVDKAQVLFTTQHRFNLLVRIQFCQHVLNVGQLRPHRVQQRRQAAIQH
ncbi:hypothetical protein D3C81_2210530 [compost metagenome]